MYQIIPIACTTVDWASYLTSASKVLGRTLDRQGIKDDLARFIVTLGEMQFENCQLKEAGSLLRHASASFLCFLPQEIVSQFREEVDLAINSSPVRGGFRLMVVSGNMQQWREAIINCSSNRLPVEIRSLSNQFMMYFEQVGLGPVWADFSKTPMSDKTFRLTAR